MLILVVEKRDARDTERAPGGMQLPLADLRELVAAGMLGAARWMSVVPPALPTRCRDEKRFSAFTRVARQHAAETQRLVVGVRRDHHQLATVAHAITIGAPRGRERRLSGSFCVWAVKWSQWAISIRSPAVTHDAS